MFLPKPVEKIKIQFCIQQFLRKSCILCDSVTEYERPGQTTDDNIIWRMPFACWTTNATYTHTLRIYNNYCLSTAATVARMRLDVNCACSASLVYQAMSPSFIEILKYSYNNQELNYLFCHSLFLPISHIQHSLKVFFTAARTCCSAQKMSAGPDAALHFQIFFDTLYKIMYNDY